MKKTRTKVKTKTDEELHVEEGQRIMNAALAQNEEHDLPIVAPKYAGKNPNPTVTKHGKPGFGPGNQVGKGHGRPKGSLSGRTKTLAMIDSVLNQPEIQAALAGALVNAITSGDKSALDTLRSIIMPLTPKEILVTDKTPGAGQPGERKLGVKIVVAQQNNTQVNVGTVHSPQPQPSVGQAGNEAGQTTVEVSDTTGSSHTSD